MTTDDFGKGVSHPRSKERRKHQLYHLLTNYVADFAGDYIGMGRSLCLWRALITVLHLKCEVLYLIYTLIQLKKNNYYYGENNSSAEYY